MVYCTYLGGSQDDMANGIAVEMAVADTILTTDMDELIEQFEAVSVTFVDHYTAARSMDLVPRSPAECCS